MFSLILSPSSSFHTSLLMQIFAISSIDEEEIDAQTGVLRQKLMTSSANGNKSTGRGQLKPHQVHELAAAKIEESEKLRKALGIREDYEEGSHWKRQEERLRDGVGERGRS